MWTAVPTRRGRSATIGHVARSVLIVDDHPGFRRTARLVLEAEGWLVVGEAGDGAAGLAAAAALAPDLVLLDVNLPDLDGFEVAARLARPGAAPAVVLTSSRDDACYGPLAAGTGACGFIPKADLSGPALAALLP